MRNGENFRAVAALVASIALPVWTSFLCPHLAASQSHPAALSASSAPAGAQILHYGSDPLQFGELRLPQTKDPVPVVIVVHGGCWADHLPGAHPLPDASLTQPLAAALTHEGIATWNIEYRRAGSPGGGWPNTYLDLAEGVDYLRKIAPAYKLDLSNVFVIGHSSGGQLALWMGVRPKLPATSSLYTPDPLAIKEIIDIDGPPDLGAAQPLESQFCPMPAITQFMGGTPSEQLARYRDGSAQSWLPLNIPQIIISAGLLQHVGTLATKYKADAEAKGDNVSVVFLESNHFAMLDPQSKPGKAVLAIILAAVNSKR